MIPLDAPFRPATEADAPQLAELVNFAGEGLPLHLWQGLAKAGEDPWQIGRARQADKARDGQIVVVDTGGGAIAGLTGYVIGPEPIGADVPALFRPLQELENEAPDTWYVNVVACYPAHRGQGHGSRLLSLADRIAQAEGMERMSVIVAGDNMGARRLYERHGYGETARRACIRDGWQTATEEWVLLTKPL
ncbi:N-acetyltransferase [Aestuariicoccus sp. MJ-SS9]|uniref:GNAT family N-acetyltransferase n=1 Tax=Aestuariicoccus sp. MJ-SS9 TaxID=3079855 RepID=UPI002913760E|nr:N-acetyltransferase [Aestuariicoccus sp. MJ-SS9]MDU8912797.1 N-acetyltransferase [Aestuariicoccus sp. MJ-SS9]